MSVFNGAKYLPVAIESILGQSFADFEFLIIDDGSTDDSVSLIEGYRDPRIRLVRNERNLGLAASLNLGLEIARGEYVARMDDDDISRPERLACQVGFMDAHPAVGVCGSWVRVFPGFDDYIWKFAASSEDIRCRLFYKVGVAHPAVMLRKKPFAEHSLFYDPAYRAAQDYELWGRAIRQMEFANVQRVLLDYRIGQGEAAARNAARQMESVAPLRLQRLHELGVEPTPEQQQLHETIMNDLLPADEGALAQAEVWLLQLEAANRKSRVYPELLFARHMCYLWFEFCCRSSDAGVCSWERYSRSPLFTRAPYSLLERVRFAGAWLARRLKRKGSSSGRQKERMYDRQ
ncbi:MAG: hypothetical protein A2075_15675 [Geobacteraceae bacterium GWC2_58_44]|nr:MAG: hypothetical protein A2075_15675 [Geobacteraceae bacterium GWC2_58_44]